MSLSNESKKMRERESNESEKFDLRLDLEEAREKEKKDTKIKAIGQTGQISLFEVAAQPRWWRPVSGRWWRPVVVLGGGQQPRLWRPPLGSAMEGWEAMGGRRKNEEERMRGRRREKGRGGLLNVLPHLICVIVIVTISHVDERHPHKICKGHNSNRANSWSSGPTVYSKAPSKYLWTNPLLQEISLSLQMLSKQHFSQLDLPFLKLTFVDPVKPKPFPPWKPNCKFISHIPHIHAIVESSSIQWQDNIDQLNKSHQRLSFV